MKKSSQTTSICMPSTQNHKTDQPIFTTVCHSPCHPHPSPSTSATMSRESGDAYFGISVTKEEREAAEEKRKQLNGFIPLHNFAVSLMLATTTKEQMEHYLARPKWLHEYEDIGMKAFGYFLYRNSTDVEKEYTDIKEPATMKNRPIPPEKPDFKIESRISKRTYQAVHIKTGKPYWVKLNHEPSRNWGYHDFHFHKEWLACLAFTEELNFHRSHVLEFSAYYYHPKLETSFFFRPLLDNLDDIIKAAGGQLGAYSAKYLALETLEAVHDCHVHGITHRDIRPRNFLIGRGENFKAVYLIGFAACILPKSMQLVRESLTPLGVPVNTQIAFKCRHFDWRFTPRVYHTSGEYLPIHDIEAWLFMVVWLFNPDFLPWNGIHPNSWDVIVEEPADFLETALFNMKNRFFTGFHDEMYPFLCREFFSVVRNFIEMNCTHSQQGFLDYGFLAWKIELVDPLNLKETLDWVGVDDNTPNKLLPKDQRSVLVVKDMPDWFDPKHKMDNLKPKDAKPEKPPANYIITPTPVSTPVAENIKIEPVNNLDDDEAEAPTQVTPTQNTQNTTQNKEGPTQEAQEAEDIKEEDPAEGVQLPSFSAKKKDGSDEKEGGSDGKEEGSDEKGEEKKDEKEEGGSNEKA